MTTFDATHEGASADVLQSIFGETVTVTYITAGSSNTTSQATAIQSDVRDTGSAIVCTWQLRVSELTRVLGREDKITDAAGNTWTVTETSNVVGGFETVEAETLQLRG